jgi:PEP-CTERM motif
VKHSLRILLLVALVTTLGVSAFGSSYTLTFDDLPYPGGGVPIPNGYGGLNWSNEFYVDGTLLPGTGYDNGIVSPNNVAFDAFAAGATLTTVSGFLSLDSGWFTSAHFTNVDEIDTYLGGNLTGAFVFPALTSQPTFVDFGGVLFDTAFIFSNGDQLVIDNLTLDTSSPTPEPASMLLLGTGALTLMSRLRKRSS